MATANPDGLRCGALRRDSVSVSTAFRSLTEWRGATSGIGTWRTLSAPQHYDSYRGDKHSCFTAKGSTSRLRAGDALWRMSCSYLVNLFRCYSNPSL
jgi:hypothetical protein